MAGAHSNKAMLKAVDADRQKRVRRLLKQKVRRGEVLKLINKGLERYDRQRRARRIDRRIHVALIRYDARLTRIVVSLRVLAQRRLLEPALDRLFGRTLIERD